MNNIKDHSFLLLEEIPLIELPDNIQDLVIGYRQGEYFLGEALHMLEEQHQEEIMNWISTNNELSKIFTEEIE